MTDERSPHAPLVGLGYLAALLVLVLLAVASYRKDLPWQRGVEVSVVTAEVGPALNPHAEVKIKGVTIGEVTGISSDGRAGVVHLRLDRDSAHLVPAAADAAIVPKTLFGERYIDLVMPPGPAGPSIAPGAVIRQSSSAVEVGELYTHLDAVLHALRPDQLSVALGSLAGALRGRGGRLGDTAATLDTYLAGLNPRLPDLVRDLHRLTRTSDVYARAAPDLLRTLDNASAISTDLLVRREDDLARLLTGARDATGRLDDLVRKAGPPLLATADRARPVLALLAEYAPSYPCLVRALNVTGAAVDQIAGSRGPWFAASGDTVVSRRGYRAPADLPGQPTSTANNAVLPPLVPSWAPHCAVVPSQLAGDHGGVRRVGPGELRLHPPVAGPGGGGGK